MMLKRISPVIACTFVACETYNMFGIFSVCNHCKTVIANKKPHLKVYQVMPDKMSIIGKVCNEDCFNNLKLY